MAGACAHRAGGRRRWSRRSERSKKKELLESTIESWECRDGLEVMADKEEEAGDDLKEQVGRKSGRSQNSAPRLLQVRGGEPRSEEGRRCRSSVQI